MTVLSESDHVLKKHDSHQQVIRGVQITLLLLIIIWIGSVGILTLSLLNRVARLQRMAADPARLNLTAVADEVHGARQEVYILHGELAPLLWLGAGLGGDLGAAEPLMEAGVESLVAADESLSALTPSLGNLGLSSFSMEQMPQILDALATARPALEHAGTHLEAAAAALARIKGSLSPRVERWVSQAGRLVQLAQYGIGGAQIAPGLLGQESPRTYLVLIQNSDELRPTGGFISAVGRVEISHGQLISMTVQDSYAIDDFTKEYPYPPQQLLDYMGSEQWVLRDANWSPDFPTTALEAIHLYQISQPEQVDGVIGLNLKGIEMLIAGLEPLDVLGLPEPVTAANVIQILRETWNPSQDISRSSADWKAWYSTRKQFIGVAMRAAMDKLLAGKANWTQLGLETIDAFSQRQLMIYTSPEADMLRLLRWDGALRSNVGDYLMVVDANVGFNKSNVLVSESLNYQVTLLPDGTGHAVVGLNYKHQGTGTDVVCTQMIPYVGNITYDKLIHTCYYDYLRLVVPRGSQLREATAHQVPGKYLLSGVVTDGKVETLSDDPSGWTVFGQFFVVEYGKQLQTRFEYDLPVVVTDVAGQKRYVLLLQKQSGTDAMPVQVKLILPARSRLISASPSPAVQSGTVLEFDLRLDVDRQIEVNYALAP
ncbi:MAG: DUF4012 domain-containing protein [Chloroflexi bacterium]|nr:DUF4012 domain-containing protein [Chloroflexota bacterium]